VFSFPGGRRPVRNREAARHGVVRLVGIAMASGSIGTDEVLDPRSLLQRVADEVLEVVEGAGGVLVGLCDESSVTFITGSGFLKPHVGTEIGVSSSLAGLAITTRKVMRCDDTANDDTTGWTPRLAAGSGWSRRFAWHCCGARRLWASWL
jgi:hypothetical protein